MFILGLSVSSGTGLRPGKSAVPRVTLDDVMVIRLIRLDILMLSEGRPRSGRFLSLGTHVISSLALTSSTVAIRHLWP